MEADDLFVAVIGLGKRLDGTCLYHEQVTEALAGPEQMVPSLQRATAFDDCVQSIHIFWPQSHR